MPFLFSNGRCVWREITRSLKRKRFTWPPSPFPSTSLTPGHAWQASLARLWGGGYGSVHPRKGPFYYQPSSHYPKMCSPKQAFPWEAPAPRRLGFIYAQSVRGAPESGAEGCGRRSDGRTSPLPGISGGAAMTEHHAAALWGGGWCLRPADSGGT